jgi:hypothetical protein
MGIFDQIKTEEQTPEQKEELEKWYEEAKRKAAAAIEAKEERFRQAEKEFEEQVNRKPKFSPSNGDGLDVERILSEQEGQAVGSLKALKFDKDEELEETEDSSRTINLVPDHFSPNAVRQDFAPRSTIQPPPMRQVVNEIRPEARVPVWAPAPAVSDASLAALTTAVEGLSKRLDVIEQNQADIANRTLNAVCNSMNEMLSLIRKELGGLSAKLVESVLDSLESLKKKEPDPEPEPEKSAELDPGTLESEIEPELEQKQDPPKPKSLGELCFSVYRQIAPGPSGEEVESTAHATMELAYERIMKSCEYDNKLSMERFMRAVRDYSNHCIEFDLASSVGSFYRWLKETI